MLLNGLLCFNFSSLMDGAIWGRLPNSYVVLARGSSSLQVGLTGYSSA